MERSGDAWDSYHRFDQDIALLAKLGLKAYRFSLEWARIEPTRGQFSLAEIDYYRRVVATCRKYGIAPALTFTHYTTPAWFAAAGGWLNPDAPALFANFCSRMAKALATDLEYAFTMNEPQLAGVLAEMPGGKQYAMSKYAKVRAMHAAAANAVGSDQFVTMKDNENYERMKPLLIAGHKAGMAAIKAERSNLPVSVTLSMIDFQPANEGSDVEAVRKRAYRDWFDAIREAGDFVPVQAYHQFRIPGPGAKLPPPPLPMPEPRIITSSIARPEASRNAVEYAYAEVRKPILVSENGLDTQNDARRIWHIDATLARLQAAMAKGVPVLGYFHWTLIDNFEWESGFAVRYGLVSVDRETFKRTPKPSAVHLGAIARRNAI